MSYPNRLRCPLSLDHQLPATHGSSVHPSLHFLTSLEWYASLLCPRKMFHYPDLEGSLRVLRTFCLKLTKVCGSARRRPAFTLTL